MPKSKVESSSTAPRRAAMRGKITKRAVDALVPLGAVRSTREDGGKWLVLWTGGRDTTLWDSDVKGFGVRVRPCSAPTPQGKIRRTYILRYRPGASGRSAPQRTHTIGQHGSPWRPENAREEALRLLGAVKGGADPAGQRAAYRGAPIVAELAARFLSEHVEAKRKARTAAEYRRLLDKIILPEIGSRRVVNVTRQDIARLHHSAGRSRRSPKRKTPYQGNRVLAVLSMMFTLAERWGLRPDGSNPCRHVEKFRERPRERMLSGEELKHLGDALTGYGGSPHAVAAIRLLMFTGARLSEVLGLRWDWIDFERGEARLPESKTGAKTLYLPPPALAVLSELPRDRDNPHAIVGRKQGARLVDLERPWRRIRGDATVRLWRESEDPKTGPLVAKLARELEREPTAAECLEAARKAKIELPAGMVDVRLHDLRHAFASIAASSGMGLPIIGRILGHAHVATTQRYAHLAADPVKAAAATIAGKIADAMRGAPGRGNVVTMPAPRPGRRKSP